MTVWIAHQELTAEEEENLAGRPYIVVPWKDLPDLSAIHSRDGMKSLLQSLMPDAPPETVGTRLAAIWPIFKNVHPEDLVAVPLPMSKKLLIGEVTGGYHYIKEQGLHSFPVQWQEKPVPMIRFGRMAEKFSDTTRGVYEVDDVKLRTRIRDFVPLGHNRFRHFKWILGIAFLMQLARLAHRVLG